MPTPSFNARIDELSTLLRSFAYNLTKNSEDARDLFQETMYKAMSNQEKFRPNTNMKAWLFTIMKNSFINNYRRKVKANTIKDNTQNLYYLNSGQHNTVNAGESNIMMNELNAMIANLEYNIRAPFVMHYEGYKYQEIADHLSLPLGTVKSRIFFARQELKEVINHNYDNIGVRRKKK